MYGGIACVTAMLLGIDFGYRPRSEGGVEYLIQIEPQTLESLKNGAPLESAIPPQVRDVRAYRITVGTGPLPHVLPPPPAEKREKPRPAEMEHRHHDEAPSPNRLTENTPGESFPHSRSDIHSHHSDEPPPSPSWPGIHPGSVNPSPPRTFLQDPSGRPIPEQSASFIQSGSSTTGPSSAGPQGGVPEQTPSKPWIPLVLSVVLLSASVTCNGYLLWLLYEGRQRYRAIVDRRGAG
jgi:hypothetical protein